MSPSICEQNGHEWQSTGFTQQIDSTTLEIEYECVECGVVEYDYKTIFNYTE